MRWLQQSRVEPEAKWPWWEQDYLHCQGNKHNRNLANKNSPGQGLETKGSEAPYSMLHKQVWGLPLVGPFLFCMACCSSEMLSLRTTSASADFSSWSSSSCIWTRCSREAMRSVTSMLLAAEALSSAEERRENQGLLVWIVTGQGANKETQQSMVPLGFARHRLPLTKCQDMFQKTFLHYENCCSNLNNISHKKHLCKD